jgi:hypothetical protein
MDFLFHFQLLIGVIAQKSLSSAETDLVESTTVQQLWACVTTKKLILDNFLKSSKLSIVAAKIVRIKSPYTSNASDSHTALWSEYVRPSAETDLVESTTVQQLWACVTTKKLILDIFSIRPNCQS